MIKNIIKVLALCIITILSIQVSSYCINDYVIEVKNKQKTLADALVEQQAKKMLEEAEKKIEQAKVEEHLDIDTEKIEMKPPVEKPEINDDKDNADNKEESQGENTDSNNQENSSSDGSTENVADSENSEETDDSEYAIIIDGLGKYKELDSKAKTEIVQYLIDRYFLDGYVYCANEKNPELLARKQLTLSMENYVLNSAQELYGVIAMLKQLSLDGTSDIFNNVSQQKDEFVKNFKDVGQNGEEFNDIYTYIVQYFDKCIEALTQLNNTADSINNSPNKILALTFAVSTINDEIIPKFKDIINSACDLKEKTNAIYLEGTENMNGADGTTLMTKEEVLDIINKIENAMINSDL